jgi:hypothetical protein
MPLEIPQYISETGIDNQPLQYTWDDDHPGFAYGDEKVKLENRIALIARQGQAMLGAAISEWVVGRLNNHSDALVPAAYIEAVWAAIIDWRYLNPDNSPEVTMEWEDWRGKVRGPLCAVCQLLNKIAKAASRNKPCAYNVVCLNNLAEHTIQNPKAYLAWRKSLIERLIMLCPKTDLDPMGSSLPREVCNLRKEFTKAEMTTLLRAFIINLQPRANKFLRSPEALAAIGFEGEPYKI